MENVSFTRDLVIVLATAFLGGFLAKKLRQPLLSGYILGGVIVGVVFSNFFQFSSGLSSLSEIGIAFLMFSLGLEFSLSRFKKLGKIIILGAIIQILATILISLLFLGKLGFDFYSSIFLGCCFSLSSTAVVLKILTDKGELETLQGQISEGWLLVQDLSVLPMIIILPALGNLNSLSALGNLGIAFLKAVILLGGVVWLGKKIMPFLVEKVLSLRSRELLLLSIVSLCLVLAFVTASLGFSFAMGAFLAGFLISEIGISASVFGELRPLRDIFAVIFFVTLGFLLSPAYLFSHWPIILILSLIIIFLKIILVFGLILFLGYHTRTAVLTAFALAQVGEFAPVLGLMGRERGMITAETNFLIITVTLLTIIATPWLMGFSPLIYRKFKFFSKLDKRPIKEELELNNHIVLCGYGRVGKYIGRALQMANLDFIVVDNNHQLIKELTGEGIRAVYGDPCEIDVLDYAQIDQARLLVIAIPDRQSQEIVIGNAQTLNPKIKIICRTHREENQASLKALRVQTVIQPEFEAALAIVRKLLSEFGVEENEISGKVSRLKIEHGLG